MKDNEYEVGYRKPPKVTRFNKGRSGNPKGRPKQSRNLVGLIDEELDILVVIQESGKKAHLTKREVLAKQIVNGALNGNAKSTSALISMDQHRQEKEPEAIELTATDIEQYQRLQQRIIDNEQRKQVRKKRPKPVKPNPLEKSSGL
jgi:hypothetical protein